MKYKIWQQTLIILLYCLALVNCNTFKNSKQKGNNWEGYIFLSFKMFNDIDEKGIPINAVSGNHMLTGERRMYLYRDFLIDVVGNQHYVEGKYVKTDTSSYEFYDLANQKFVYFDKFSIDARILKKGSMSEGGSFSKMPEVDPMTEIPDSIWRVNDTIIEGRVVGVVSFIYPDVTDTLAVELTKRTKIWVNYTIKDFPLQLSYKLSRKLNGAFVYKTQLPAPEGKAVLVTTLEYKPINFPDTLVQIFNKWAQIARE